MCGTGTYIFKLKKKSAPQMSQGDCNNAQSPLGKAWKGQKGHFYFT